MSLTSMIVIKHVKIAEDVTTSDGIQSASFMSLR